MTFQPTQLQALIDEIDGALSKASPRLPWVMAGDVDQQRRLLEQTRNYLVSLQKQPPTPSAASPYDPATALPSPQGSYGQPQASAESAQQVLQSVLQEMSYLRSNIMQPMRTDIEALRQEREALQQEVRQLESQRQQNMLPASSVNQQQMITDFLQALMGRMQETLSSQVTQMLTNAQVMALQDRALSGNLPANGSGAIAEQRALSGTSSGYYDITLTPAQRLEQAQMLQSQSDQLLLKLDSTLKVFFESLQSNVESYQDSLSEGLSKMHTLGQQGEAMFSAMVTRLAQQLGREASGYLQSPGSSASLPPTVAAAAAAMPQLKDDPITVLQPDAFDEPDAISEAQIDQLLAELQGEVIEELPEGDAVTPASEQQSETQDDKVTLPPQADLSSLSLLNLELDELDLGSPISNTDLFPDDEDLTFVQSDEPEDEPEFPLDEEALMFFSEEGSDLTFLQTDEAAMSQDQPGFGWTEESNSSQPIANLDAAVELLNQLNLDLPENSQHEETAASTEQLETEASEEPVDESFYDELDEFYESLFGDSAIAPTANAPDASPNPDAGLETDTDAFAALGWDTAAPSSLSPTEPPLESNNLFEFESQLFEGLEDPAIADTSEVFGSDLDEQLSGEYPYTNSTEPDASLLPLESLLFDEQLPGADSPQPSNDASEENLFTNWDTSSASIPELSEDRFNTDSSSQISLSQFNWSQPETQEASQTPSDLLIEDIFETASPDEDLLPTETDSTPNRFDLTVDNWTLERLQEDLSQFEDNPELDSIQFLAEPAQEADFAQDPIELAAEESFESAIAPDEVMPPLPDGDQNWLFELRGVDISAANETTIDAEVSSVALSPDDFPEAAVEAMVSPPATTPTPPGVESPVENTGVAGALSDDFLAALLGDAPISTEVTPPALEVTPQPQETSIPESAFPESDSYSFELDFLGFDASEPASLQPTASETAPSEGSTGPQELPEMLTPDREDLSLEDYLAVMGQPSSAEAADLGSFSDVPAGLPDILTPDREDLSLEDYLAVMGTSSLVEEPTVEEPTVEEPAEVAPPQLADELLADAGETLDDLFVQSSEPAPEAERAVTLGDFIEGLPDAPAEPPTLKSVGSSEPIETLDLSELPLMEFPEEKFAKPSNAADESAEAPGDSTPSTSPETFTLEGLDELFEDLPPVEKPANAPSVPNHSDVTPPSADAAEDLTIENLFGADFGSQASLDLYNQQTTEAAQKKRPQP